MFSSPDNKSQWKRSQNILQPSSSNIDTLSFPNTNINISESITGYTPTRLYNFNTGSLQDSLAQGQDMTISIDVTPTSHQLDFSGDDIECQVPSITPNSSEYSVQVRLSLTTMTGSPSVIMSLTNQSNPGGTNSIQIRRSFSSIQARFNSVTSGDTSFQTIADVTDIENQGYINFWITRYNTTFTVDISNISILTHTMEHPTDSLRLILLEDQYITDPDIWTGNLERVVVFPRALSETERRDVESVGTIPKLSDYQVKNNLTVHRPLDMDGNRILNVSQPSTAGDVATKTYVDNAIGGQNAATQLLDQNDNVIINTLSGQVVVDNKRIEGVALPQGSNHAANRDYVQSWVPQQLNDGTNTVVDTNDGKVNVSSYITRIKNIGDNKKSRTLSNYIFDWTDLSTAYIILSTRETQPEGLTAGSLTIRGSGRNRDVQAKGSFTAEVTWITEGEAAGTRRGNLTWNATRPDIILSLVECEFNGFMSICIKVEATGNSGIREQIGIEGQINSDTYLPTLSTATPTSEAPIANTSINFDSPIQVNTIDTRSGDEIDFSNNTLLNIHTAQFNGQADAGLQPALLRLTQGQSEVDFNESPQISFGYNGSTNFQHFITTTHNSNAQNNSIHIFTCDGKSNNTLTDGSDRVWSFDNQENRSYKNLNMESNEITGASDVTTSKLTTGTIESSTATKINAGGGQLRMTSSQGDFYFQTGDGTYQPLRLGVVHNSTSSRLDIKDSETVSKQPLSMNTSHRITDCADPINDQDVATQGWVKTQISNIGDDTPYQDVWFTITSNSYSSLSQGSLIPNNQILTNWQNSNFNDTTYQFSVSVASPTPILELEVDLNYNIYAITGTIFNNPSEPSIMKSIECVRTAEENRVLITALDTSNNNVDFSATIRISLTNML